MFGVLASKAFARDADARGRAGDRRAAGASIARRAVSGVGCAAAQARGARWDGERDLSSRRRAVAAAAAAARLDRGGRQGVRVAAEAGAAASARGSRADRRGPADARLPWFWDIYRWLEGATQPVEAIDAIQAANDLAGFVAAMQKLDPAN